MVASAQYKDNLNCLVILRTLASVINIEKVILAISNQL